MHRRRLSTVLAIAVLGAASLTLVHGDEPLTERVVRLETQEAFPEAADELNRYDTDVRLALLDYAGDDELVLHARLALKRYPEKAGRVIGLYGPAEPFKKILRGYGPEVIPPVYYFIAHEVPSLELRALAAEPPPSPQRRERADGGKDEPPSVDTPGVRGWYAIAFIEQEGHDFLGQFVVDRATGEVSWVQTERFATGAKRLLTSGLTGLEAKWQRGDELAASDYGWAAVDVLAPIAAFKIVRAGKIAGRSAKSVRAGARTAKVGARLGRAGRTIAIAGTAAGIGYVALNPSVLNSLGAGIAATLGVPSWAVNGVIWFVVLLPALMLVAFAQRWLVRPAYRLLAIVITGLVRLQRRLTPHAQ